MPAISFQRKFLDDLLSGRKQQTTRRQTDRFKVGAVAQLYIEQRRKITDKPERHLTECGIGMMCDRYGMTKRQKLLGVFPEHFLGKVEIAEVYDIQPCEMSGEDLEAWAWADGFGNFDPVTITPELVDQSANWWFSERYGNDWMHRWWTVIRWHGWLELYFEPEEI